MFAPQQSSLLAVPSRRHFAQPRKDDIDDFLSSDLEASFASNVSINSPPRDYKTLSSDVPMDISPAPSRLPVAFESMRKPNRPRAFTTSARLFGNDISNGSKGLLPSPSLTSEAFTKPSSSIAINQKPGRSAFPSELHFNVESIEFPRPSSLQEPTSPLDDAMDIDTSYCADEPPVPQHYRQPHTAVGTTGGFSSLFFDESSPRRPQAVDTPSEPRVKKRRSFSPEPSRSFLLEEDSSFGPLESSPSQPRLQKKPSIPLLSNLGKAKPMLAGLGAPSALQKRPRRPALSTMLGAGERIAHPTKSAFPVLASAGLDDEIDSPKGSAPVRRAFSAALIPPAPFADASFDAESSFEGPDMSSPAQAYSKRQQVKTLRRCDGTEDFRPATGASALSARDSPSSRYLTQNIGMPGFGDNEAHGKILPCHRVREDGLMRITSQTLDKLLDGQYDSQITEYRVIDCRFDYEYAGGHIPGAINVNTTNAVEDLLLNGSGLNKPKPSTSGDTVKKTILVFHCEFSAKRGPTFAKHFRAKDRAMNNHIYPKIHFPELYILEGGYCEYYRNSGNRCEPMGYVTMDDPTHAASRREDLDQFRKGRFGRVKSYAYGDGIGKLSASQPGGKRNITPPEATHGKSATASFIAGSHLARHQRRVGSVSLLPLHEHANTSLDGDDTDVDIGDSPCPPANKNAGRKLGRGFARSETYHAVRMVY